MIKRFVEGMLVGSGGCWALRHLYHPSVILAYHNVLPVGTDPGGDAGLHIDEDNFKRQLDRLASTHEVVPLETLLSSSGDARRCRAAITFDDAYRGALRIGVRELERRGMPATIFVSPGLLGDVSPWWDAMAEQGVLDPDLRSLVLEKLNGEQDRAAQWASQQGLNWSESPPHTRTATEEELLAVADNRGVRLQAHGWGHANMETLEPEAVETECEEVLGWLADHGGDQPPLLAYPYGRVSPEAEKVVREHFSGAVLVSGGIFQPDSLPNRYRIPRINVDRRLSAQGMELRTSGLRR